MKCTIDFISDPTQARGTDATTVFTPSPHSIVPCIRNRLQSIYNPVTEKFYDPASKKWLMFDEALANRVVNPWTTAVMNWDFMRLFFLPEARRIGLINDDGQIFDCRTEKFISLEAAVANETLVDLELPIGIQEAFHLQLYLPESAGFRVPGTDQAIPWTSALGKAGGFIDADTTFIINHLGKCVPIKAALSLGQVSENGYIQTKKGWVSLEKAFEMNLIRTISLPLKLEDLITLQLWNPAKGMIEFQNEEITLHQAIKKGLVTIAGTRIENNRGQMTGQLAVQKRLLNLHTGDLLNEDTGYSYKFEQWSRTDLARTRNVPSIVSAVQRSSYNLKWKRLIVGNTYQYTYTIRDALETGLIHSNSCFVRDWKTDGLYTFKRAHEIGLLDLESAVCYHDKSGVGVPLPEAVKKGMIFELQPPIRFSEIISKQLVLEKKQLIFQASSGRYVTFKELVASGELDVCSFQVEDTRKSGGRLLSFSEACDIGVIDSKTGAVTDFLNCEVYHLEEAWHEGFIIDSKPPFTAYEAAKRGLFLGNGEILDPETGNKWTFTNALRRKLIDPALPALFIKGKVYSLLRAVTSELICTETGNIRLGEGLSVPFDEALRLGVILNSDSSFTLIEALCSGLARETKTGELVFPHPTVRREYNIEQAIKCGLIRKTGTVLTIGQKFIPLEVAINSGVFDIKTGNIHANGYTISILEGLVQKIFVPSNKPLTLDQIFMFELFNQSKATFCDPEVGNWLTLQEALKDGLLDENATFFMNSTNGDLKSISAAINSDMISMERGLAFDERADEWIRMDEAFEKGIIISTEKSLSFEDAFRRSLINVNRCTYTDPRFEQTIPLERAVRAGWLACDNVYIKDTKEKSYMNIKSAIRLGLVDIRRRVTVDAESGQWLPLILQFPGGIITFAKKSFAFEYLMDNSYINFTTGVVTDPISSCTFTLADAMDTDTLDPQSALVKDTKGKKLIHFIKAMEREILTSKGEVIDTLSGETFSMIGALATGLILLPSKPFSLTDALEYGTYSGETKRFQSPWTVTGDVTFGEAITLGLLDHRGTMVRDTETDIAYNLDEATTRGLIDGVKGDVYDAEAGKWKSLLEAFEANLIIDVYAQESVQQSFSTCEADIDGLLTQLTELEVKLGSDTAGAGDNHHSSDLQSKIRQLQEMEARLVEVEPEITRCIVVTDQLSTDGADLLSPEEFHSLRRHRDELRENHQNSKIRLAAMLDRLKSASDVKDRFLTEQAQFDNWLGATSSSVDNTASKLGEPSTSDSLQDLKNDISAHKPDLHSIQSLGAQLQDELRGYSQESSALRPDGSLQSPQVYEDDEVKKAVKDSTDQYHSLAKRCDQLEAQNSDIVDASNKFRGSLGNANRWMDEIENKVDSLLRQPAQTEPSELSRQLSASKNLTGELIEGSKHLDGLRSEGDQYLSSIAGTDQYPEEKHDINTELELLNGRYAGSKEKVGAHSDELQTMLTHSQGLRVGLETMKGWLDSVDESLAVRKPLPLDKELLDEQKKEEETLRSDIESHGSALEGLRSEAQKLAMSSPSSANAGLQPELKNMTQRYEQAGRKCKLWKDNLDHAGMNLDDFETNANQLQNWLRESTSQLTTPEPSDEDVLNRIAQELPEKQSDLSRIKKSAQQLYSLPNATEIDSVRNRVSGLDEMMDGVQSALGSRQGEVQLLKQRLGAFEDQKDEVAHWLKDAEKTINDMEYPTVDPKQLESQISELDELKREHNRMGPEVARLRDLFQQLADGSGSPESAEVATARRAFENLDDAFNNLGVAVSDRQQKLEDDLGKLGKHEERRKKLEDWIEGQRSWVQSVPVPLNREEATDRLKEIRDLDSEIKGMRHEYESVKTEGHDLTRLKDVQQTPGLSALRQRNEDLNDSWDHLQEETRGLQQNVQDAKNYHNNFKQLDNWLNAKERELNNIKAKENSSPAAVQAKIDQLKLLADVFDAEKQQLEHLNEEASGLKLDGEEGDKLKEGLKGINDRWDDLYGQLQLAEDKLQATQDVNQKIIQKQEAIQSWLAPLSSKLEEMKKQGATSNSPDGKTKGKRSSFMGDDSSGSGAFGEDAADGGDPKKRLQDIESLENELESQQSLEPQLEVSLDKEIGHIEELAQLAEELSGMDGDPTMRREVMKQLEAARSNVDNMKKELEKRKEEEQIRALADEAKPVFEEVKGIEKEFKGLDPIGRDPQVLDGQYDETERLLKKMGATAEELERRRDSLNSSVGGNSTSSESLKQLQDQYRSYEGSLNDLREKGENRKGEIDRVNKDVSGVLEEMDQFGEELEKVFDAPILHQPVKGDLAGVKGQISALQEFKSDPLEPAAKKSVDLTSKVEALVSSADPNVDTSRLVSAADALAGKKEDIDNKTIQREKQLDQALMKLGNFRDAAGSLTGWLEDTEELMNNQKQPSPDHKVVKAQLQEQKLVHKLIDEKQPTLEALNNLADQLDNITTDPQEKEQIKQETDEINQRFDGLCAAADQRKDLLMNASTASKEYADTLQPVQQWLDTAEKSLEKLGNVPTEEERLQKNIHDHQLSSRLSLQKLLNDIEQHRDELDHLLDVGQRLGQLVSDEDADLLDKQTGDVALRYDELGQRSQAIGELLRETFDKIGNFFDAAEQLAEWIDRTEPRLEAVNPLSIYADMLQNQVTEVVAITEEVMENQDAVVELVEEGRELCKHTTGDEAVSLQGRLEGLRLRFTDLSKKAEGKLTQLQEAVPLSELFHGNQESVNKWLEAVESDLAQIDDAPIDQQLEIVKNMKADINDFRPVIDEINAAGSRLGQVSGEEGAKALEEPTSLMNRRFDTVAEQVQRREERLHISAARSREVLDDMDELIDWLREAESNLNGAAGASANPELAKKDLENQHLMNQDIISQKSRARDAMGSAKKLIRECTAAGEDGQAIQGKVEVLKELTDVVSRMSEERRSLLENALPLAESFAESLAELNEWLSTVESELEHAPDVVPGTNSDNLKRQQDHNMGLLQSIQEQKPFVSKFEKTGNTLAPICREPDDQWVRDAMDGIIGRCESLKDNVKIRGSALSEALQESSQFSDKLDGMLATLGAAAEQVRNPEPVSGNPEKLRDQIADNCALMEDLGQKSTAYNAVREAADDIFSKADNDDPAVFEIREKMSSLEDLWEEIQAGTEMRGRSLAETLAVAEKFWGELQGCISALKDLKNRLENAPPPARDPEVILKQQADLEEINGELHLTAPTVDAVKETGNHLLALIGEPEKPEIEQKMADLDSTWDTVTSLYHQRHDDLIEAMEKAMEFHDILRGLLEWLETAEKKVSDFPLVSGLSLEDINCELDKLQEFRKEFDKKSVEKERIRHSAADLAEGTSHEQAAVLLRPVQDMTKRWDVLSAALNERQQRLEKALLQMGQFEQAYDQLMDWMAVSNKTLDEIQPSPGDLRQAEIELAKHRVLQNDVHAHQRSVDTINDTGNKLIDSQADENPEALRKKLDRLNDEWKDLQEKLAAKQVKLEESKSEAADFGGQIQDWLHWLDDMDAAVSSTKPTGGLPETAEQQLNEFLAINEEIESRKSQLEDALFAADEHLIDAPDKANSAFAHRIQSMKQKWTHLQTKKNDRKIKLEVALADAIHFHEMITDFNEWLSSAEHTLNTVGPVSRILEKIAEQMEDHKMFQDDVQGHRQIFTDLSTCGTKLQYYCEKKDAIPIKNLLVSAKLHFDKIVTRTGDRTKQLDEGYTEAKSFMDGWKEMCDWCDERKEWLDEQQSQTATNPQKIRDLLDRHKDFQREFGTRQVMYDNTSREGRQVRDKAPKDEQAAIQDLIDILRDRWNSLSNGSIERQKALEEALLFSGKFKDAVAGLLEWLSQQITHLNDEDKVHGDLETVTQLVEQHKLFLSELDGRAKTVETVRSAAENLLSSGDAESQEEVREQMDELNRRWEETKTLADEMEAKLKFAHIDAQEFHKGTNTILEWLADMEIKLKFKGVIPESEEAIKERIKAIEKLKQEFDEKRPQYQAALDLGSAIQGKCHIRAVDPMKHWMRILQSRWEEVSAYADQREQRFGEQIEEMKEQDLLLDDLLGWLGKKENELQEAEDDPVPEEMDYVEKLIEDHGEFEQALRSRQGEVDEATKGKKKEDEVAEKDPKKPGAQKRPMQNRKPSKHPKAQQLGDRWKQIWLQSMERQRRLADLLAYLQELKRLESFDFENWRHRYLNWMNNNKSRVSDFFRRQDKDRDGKISREEFINAVLSSNFRTTRLEMGKVAEVFDENKDGFIDYQEFMKALKTGPATREPLTDKEKINDELGRQVEQCTCPHKFKINEIGEGKYKFGEGQKVRLVRILRSTVMVRVGGGWEALDEFLVKNDPCRATGRTNLELREKFILPQGAKQEMVAFQARRSPVPNGSQASGSSGNSSSRYTPQGPITKVRERTERSLPMKKGPGRTPSESEGSSVYSTTTKRSNTDLYTPGRRRGGGSSIGSSRTSSREGLLDSKPPSRPGSRADSEVSVKSGQSHDSLGATPSRIPSLRGRKGVPYSGSRR